MAGRDVSLKNQYFGLPAVPVLALLGSIVPLLYSANFASVEPVLDAWAWIAHLRSLSLGEEALLQIPFIQHNEHPLAFPTLVFLTFGRIFNYRLDAVALLHSVFIFLTSLTLLRLARLSGVKFLLPLALAALLLGSLRQCENLILGFNISITAAVVSGALSIYFLRACLDRPKPGFPTVSALCAVACALACLTSNASAVALFPATLVTLGLTPRRDRFAAAYAAGTLAAAAGWYALFFRAGPSQPLVPIDSTALLNMAEGFLALIGSALTIDWNLSIWTGSVLLAANLVFSLMCLRRSTAHRSLVAIGVFSLTVMLIIAAARGTPGNLVPSRYCSFSLPFAAVTLLLGWAVLAGVGRWARLGLGLASTAVVAVALVVPVKDAWRSALLAKAYDASVIAWMMQTDPTPPVGMTDLAISGADYLRTTKQNVFSGLRGTPRFWDDQQLSTDWATDFQAKLMRSDGDLLSFVGPGSVFSSLPCPGGSACVLRVRAYGLSGAAGNVGVVFTDRSGKELVNEFVPLQYMRFEVDGGSSASFVYPRTDIVARPYFYSPNKDTPIRLKSLTVSRLELDRKQQCLRTICWQSFF